MCPSLVAVVAAVAVVSTVVVMSTVAVVAVVAVVAAAERHDVPVGQSSPLDPVLAALEARMATIEPVVCG